jgi:RHS repeat-associated protein
VIAARSLILADSNAVYYYHFDGLGSVVALTDANGTCVQTYEYSVYGHVAASSLRSRVTAEDGSDPNHPNPFMFTGRQFDIETGLYYYRARYYNPYLGRFLQTDPVGLSTRFSPCRQAQIDPRQWPFGEAAALPETGYGRTGPGRPLGNDSALRQRRPIFQGILA